MGTAQTFKRKSRCLHQSIRLQPWEPLPLHCTFLGAFLQSRLPKHKNHILTETSPFTLSKFKWALSVCRQCTQSSAFYFFAHTKVLQMLFILCNNLTLSPPTPQDLHHTQGTGHTARHPSRLQHWLTPPPSKPPSRTLTLPSCLRLLELFSSIISSQIPGKGGAMKND